jgi:hypothetical protein
VNLIHLNQFIADTLKCEIGKSEPLAELILRKTAGNPFCDAILKSLHQESLLVFDYRRKQWEFDLDRIHRREMTDNVVTLMAGKIQNFLSRRSTFSNSPLASAINSIWRPCPLLMKDHGAKLLRRYERRFKKA